MPPAMHSSRYGRSRRSSPVPRPRTVQQTGQPPLDFLGRRTVTRHVHDLRLGLLMKLLDPGEDLFIGRAIAKCGTLLGIA